MSTHYGHDVSISYSQTWVIVVQRFQSFNYLHIIQIYIIRRGECNIDKYCDDEQTENHYIVTHIFFLFLFALRVLGWQFRLFARAR